jgi:hypothetical protein
MTASRTIIGRWSGPTEAEKRSAWAHLSDAELRDLTNKASDQGEVHTAAILAEEWIARCFEKQAAEELSDPLRHLEPMRRVA